MALNIKDPETDRLARELAGLTGETITVALRHALEERLRLERRRRRSQPDLHWIIERGRDRATRDERDEDAILGYAEDGLPR